MDAATKDGFRNTRIRDFTTTQLSTGLVLLKSSSAEILNVQQMCALCCMPKTTTHPLRKPAVPHAFMHEDVNAMDPLLVEKLQQALLQAPLDYAFGVYVPAG